MSLLHVLFKRVKHSLLWRHSISFLYYLRNRVMKEQLQVVAGYLSYVSLMSLVPLMVVALSVATAFPIFADNASKMSAVAILFLFVAALLLISSIDKTFNNIWQVTKKRRIITSFSMYWMILTIGPLLVGASIAITSYIVSLVSLGIDDDFGITSLFFRLLPLLSSLAAFVLLYMLVPNTRVPFKYALSGAFVAAVFFEFSKKIFVVYLTAFPSYQAIYGALAIVPILFLWVYLSWIIVLGGALITVSLQEYELETEG